ncbi:transcriptional regulator FeaR [Pseudomonas daroniae]|uniref:Transcriptional regulator FeaR n=1 Tax=Phytopseudomonas daroniae TaxID=2487519 RepID=A0A4Q9QK67_9GAMM|nr:MULTISPECIES: transcriptional regulator FeaR [Pseudomonas]TBU74984.1 transcriptional regulator FeaR [Pseudomonas daroniae]TBU75286.1 transcriptional regulator FeaR [Pseudomonas daroniae]TBU80356.1 transcriptional regulator FeaR [Pseudomonas sp. FRB 228]TBU89083.1 transcriptional regulator FeaR [Pseudomonas daroniae]
MSVQNLHDFDHWNHAVHAVCGRFITQRGNHANSFIGDIQHHRLGDLNLADIQVNAPSIRRERGSASRGDDGFYFLVLQREGSMAINRSARTFTLHPGDMALLDSAEAFEMQPQGLIAQLSIHLCRDAVDRLLPAHACRFGKLEQTGLSGRLLHGMLQQISEGEMNLGAGQSHGAALQDALISLLQPSLHIDDIPDTGRPLRRLAERLINEALQAPPTPAELATQLNVSVRQLYRQFELDGDSIGRYIQRQRLHCSARDLTQAGDKALPITTIAYKWGFTDSAHFSRVFKRHFGMPPKDYRAQSQKTADGQR